MLEFASRLGYTLLLFPLKLSMSATALTLVNQSVALLREVRTVAAGQSRFSVNVVDQISAWDRPTKLAWARLMAQWDWVQQALSAADSAYDHLTGQHKVWVDEVTQIVHEANRPKWQSFWKASPAKRLEKCQDMARQLSSALATDAKAEAGVEQALVLYIKSLEAALDDLRQQHNDLPASDQEALESLSQSLGVLLTAAQHIAASHSIRTVQRRQNLSQTLAFATATNQTILLQQWSAP